MESLDRMIYPHAILTASSKTDHSKYLCFTYNIVSISLSCFCSVLNLHRFKYYFIYFNNFVNIHNKNKLLLLSIFISHIMKHLSLLLVKNKKP